MKLLYRDVKVFNAGDAIVRTNVLSNRSDFNRNRETLGNV